MHTVISSFRDRVAAQRAMERLQQAGFAREDMHLQRHDVQPVGGTSAADWEGMEREVAVDRRVLESIGHFFTSLFGQEHPAHARSYTDAVTRGECVVVLDADSEAEAQRAADLLDAEGGQDRNIVPRSHERRLRDMGTEA
jgi:hypothetical protein